MSRCGHCGPGRSCCDFSSRADRLPSLASIDVVEPVVRQALINTAQRHSRHLAGDLSREDIDEADDRLLDWLGQTFSGKNRNFASAEGWNPGGLAEYVRENFAGMFEQRGVRMPFGDRALVEELARMLLADIYAVIGQVGSWRQGMENSTPAYALVMFWSRLLTGAPVDGRFH